MNRRDVLSARIQHIKEHNRLVVTMGDEILQEWCLCLAMLKEGIVQSATLHDNGNRIEISFRLDSTLPPSERMIVKSRKNTSQVSLSSNELDYLTHFFLRYFRDGVASVNHLDIEASKKGDACDLEFRVHNTLPPVTPEEAARRLGR